MVNWYWFFTWSLVTGMKIVRDVTVDEGSSVILNCTCISNENEVTWRGPNRSSSSSEKDENDTMPYTMGLMLNPQLNSTVIVIRNNNTGECILKIGNFSKLDEGSYICEDVKLKAREFKVFVKSKPTNLSITTSREKQSMTVVEGKNSNLLCQVHSGRPREELKLIINDLIKENGSGLVIYNFTPRKSDHNVSVSCVASSNIMKYPLVKKTRLNVHFKPTANCTLQPKQLIEGNDAKLCCVVESNPPSNITWIKTDNESSLLIKPNGDCLVWSLINRTQEGCYKYKATNYLGAANSTINVQVFYPPIITVTHSLKNGTLNLECNPTGVPNKYTSLQLEHRSEFNEHIRFMKFVFDGSVLRTSIGNAGVKDIGIYVCNVSNGVHDKNGRKFKSGKILVKLEDAPVFLDVIRYAKIGEIIDISVIVYNRHNVTEAEIHSISTIQPKRNITHQIKINRSFVKVQKMYHGSNITLNASQVSFQLDRRTQKNFAKCILKICNKYGCTYIKIDIIIDTSKNQGSARSKYQDVEIVFAALGGSSVLGIGMVVAFVIWKRVTDKDKSTLSQTEDLGEDTEGQSVENRLYQSREIVNTDNPAHVLQAQANGGYVYHAIASSSQSEPTRNDQSFLSGSQLNYSEVVFEAGPSSKSNIIHGAYDKTIYLEIDLVQSASYKLDSCDTSSEEDFIYIDGIVNPERKNEFK